MKKRLILAVLVVIILAAIATRLKWGTGDWTYYREARSSPNLICVEYEVRLWLQVGPHQLMQTKCVRMGEANQGN